MIHLTDQATKKILEEKTKHQLSEEYYLRIAVEEGGCSGMKYTLKFDKDKTANDEIFDLPSLSVIVNKKDNKYLSGITLNFSDGLDGKGFYFDNPNAHSTCGCGRGFSV